MATLVLSTVGTALGGPVGGAIGALLGQSFDQQLLGPASRGPRLGDLSVQTSSYGTQIPRIYGSMRVAGSVIWATDLIESGEVTGAKGQPDVTYSYSVSMAVAISSRPVQAIGRIWADGKLLRGAEGDFKSPVTFRFHDGEENQEIDPLIGSIEGIANTPAYRGLAVAVFENLELAAFGNRIPFLTFEVIADPEAPALGSILADASAGMIASDASETIGGYAAYGRSIGAALLPIVEGFDVPLFDDGISLRPPVETSPVPVNEDELGNSIDARTAPRVQRERLPASAVPATLRLAYYDPELDYQTAEARAVAGEQSGNEAQQEVPAVLSADSAKGLAQRILARHWSARDKVTLRLPPARIGLEPGTIVRPPLNRACWIVEKCTIEGFVTVVELRPADQPSAVPSGDAGRIVPCSDLVDAPTALALIDAPTMADPRASGPTIFIAASSNGEGWSARPLTVTWAGQTFSTRTAARKSTLGRAIAVLPAADPFLIDEAHSIDIELIDPVQWLTGCDDEALAGGANLSALGSELIQFGAATPLGDGRFRLSRLLRGRGGTEWACERHAIDEPFCLIESGSLQPLALPAWSRGSLITVADRKGSSTSINFDAESARPLAPENLSGRFDADGNLVLSWVRRSRAGLAWLDEIDAPIGEQREDYRVTIAGTGAVLEFAADRPERIVPSADVAALGPGAAAIEVRQIGDWAASRPAELTIDLP